MKIFGAVLEASGQARPFARSQPITVSELDLDAPGPLEVLVRIESAGLCHSDLSVVNGDRPRPVPMLLGHEAAGIVEVLGDDVPDLTVGDRVVLTFLPRCGTCPGCLAGGRLPCEPGSASNLNGTLFNGETRLSRDGSVVAHHLGVSGFANYAVVDYRSVVAVDHDVPAEVAALLGCAVLTGGGAVINEAQIQLGETTIIVGLGGVGMAALLTAIAVGQGPVIGVDTNDEKLALALELGAESVYTPQDALSRPITAACVIEAAGNAHAFETAVGLTAIGGKTITVGLPHPDARSSISPLGLVAQARTIVGSYLGSALPQRDIPIFANYWRGGKLPVEKLVSSHISLEGINEAMDLLAEGKALRQMITFPTPDRANSEHARHQSESAT